MADFISNTITKINSEIISITSKDKVTKITTGHANKLWRAAILLHRATHGPEASTFAKNGKDPAKTSKNVLIKKADRNNKEKEANAKVVRVNLQPHTDLLKAKDAIPKNQIIIYNLTSKPYEYIVIQNRPNTVEFKGETTWATIKSMGRNTPLYHYTGSEDTVQFNISWFCTNQADNTEVVKKCRFLEAWSKSNGYQAAPPVLRIQWGAEDVLFKNHLYILISATYTLENFNDCYRKVNGENITREVVDGKLLPSTATQELIFKRVSATNLAWNDILPMKDLQGTNGINSNI